ncbi:SMP-30/gluconolactonase/LRE family protein [Marinivivus vitaminiproducens]|uniref:SMP-30/gluconolactonase/LRE family protein n=1 Tax=Marinivivus vitaminiproducens TaxID=3035935 RepID=UPI00279ABCF4|nr:SMP-30/gluconolactonase/LRE family protein [Geminicoccaceae bacterium SCSIO 64248]
MTETITRLTDIVCATGESPVWEAERNALWWADIPAGTIYRLDVGTNEVRDWTLPEPVGSFGLYAEGGALVVGLRSGVYRFEPESGALDKLVDPEPGKPDNRLNDGKVGPDGAFWVGSMREVKYDGPPTGALYRVTADGRCETKVDPVITSNGLAFSADGRTLFHTDSAGQWIDRYDLDPASGAIGNKARIATPGDADGRPDGGACDVEGCYWSCGVSAGVINRYDRDGKLLQKIPVPCDAPTMPCFAGPDMKTLYFTSLKRDTSTNPNDGGLFVMQVDVAGAPIGRFG